MKLFEHVVKIQKKLPEDDSDRLFSELELGLTYLGNHRYHEAIKLLAHVGKVGGKLPDKRQLITLRALLSAYRANGQVGKAQRLEEDIAKMSKPPGDE